MIRIEKSTFINVPVEKAFTYFSDPAHMVEWWPSLQEVRNVEELPDSGHRYDWTYKMAGMTFDGTSESAEVVPNERVVSKSSGGIPSTFVWTFQPEGEGTRLGVDVEYEIPQTLLGRVAEPFIRMLNEREGDNMLANLKDRLEMEMPVTA